LNSTGRARAQQTPARTAENEVLEKSLLIDEPKPQPSLLPHLQLFWAKRRFLLRAATYAMLVSTLVAFLVPARFESTARLMPPENQPGSGLAMAAAALSGTAGGLGLGGIASDFLGFKSTSEVFVGILNSVTVQDKLIQQFDLKKRYGLVRMDDVRKALAEHTSTSVERKSQIITISVTDKNPATASAMCGAYVDELNRLVAELSTSSARRERIFLEGRLQAVNRDLEEAEKEFSQFASKNSAIDIKEQGKAMVEAAATLQGQLIAAESQLEGLKAIYTDNNIRVRALRARVAELKLQLEKIGGKGEDTSVITGQQDTLYPSIRKLPVLGVTYADLYRRTKVQEAIFEQLTKEYELAKVQEVKEIPTVKVLDRPNMPDKRSFPPRVLIVFLGTALVTILSMAWLLGRTHWAAIEPGDPAKIFAMEVFTTVQASIPKFSRNGNGVNQNGHRSWMFWGRPEERPLGDREDKQRDNE
jgi:capsule polysaccharide export protein KpsE/RkpR